MSTGSWDPTAGSATSDLQLTPELLERFILYSEQDQLGDLQALVGNPEEQLARIMQIDHALWHDAAATLPSGSVQHLIRFLAMAENLAGWEAGASSPVIPLAKILRKRGDRLDKPFLQWLREVNDNRFLPYGPL